MLQGVHYGMFPGEGAPPTTVWTAIRPHNWRPTTSQEYLVEVDMVTGMGKEGGWGSPPPPSPPPPLHQCLPPPPPMSPPPPPRNSKSQNLHQSRHQSNSKFHSLLHDCNLAGFSRRYRVVATAMVLAARSPHVEIIKMQNYLCDVCSATSCTALLLC